MKFQTFTGLSTRKAAMVLGVEYWRLGYLLATGKLPRPPRDEDGRHYWTEEDIGRASVFLAGWRTTGPRKKAAGHAP
jgi:hypothetical protein